jgi:hypothetical protein
VLTLFLQFGEHFSAIHAGLTTAPFAIGTTVGATLGAGLLAPRFGRLVLQVATLPLAGSFFWLHQVIAANALHTSTLDLVPPELLLGVGLGMMVSPLFDFILAGVDEHEAGSASGVLNAVQQLAGALGVAVLGTIFFAELGHAGFVAAINRCLLVTLATTPVLLVLTTLLPKHARDETDEATSIGESRVAVEV